MITIAPMRSSHDARLKNSHQITIASVPASAAAIPKIPASGMKAGITILNIFGVRLVALINNTGVIFEILGMVVFAFILAIFHNHQGVGVIFDSGGTDVNLSTFLVAMFMSLYVIYGFDTASTLAEETKDPRREAPKAVIGDQAAILVV